MKVYHVYECFYDEPWYPEEASARIYKNYTDAKEYFDSLIEAAIADGQELECQEERFAQFNTDEWDEFKIYIDEYEVR